MLPVSVKHASACPRDAVHMSIGARIEECLESTGMTQAGLAKACGVKPSAVSQWKRGQVKGIKPEHLLRLVRTLGVRVEWLVLGELPKKQEKLLSPDALRIGMVFDQMTDIEKREVAGYIEFLLNKRTEVAGRGDPLGALLDSLKMR